MKYERITANGDGRCLDIDNWHVLIGDLLYYDHSLFTGLFIRTRCGAGGLGPLVWTYLFHIIFCSSRDGAYMGAFSGSSWQKIDGHSGRDTHRRVLFDGGVCTRCISTIVSACLSRVCQWIYACSDDHGIPISAEGTSRHGYGNISDGPSSRQYGRTFYRWSYRTGRWNATCLFGGGHYLVHCDSSRGCLCERTNRRNGDTSPSVFVYG